MALNIIILAAGRGKRMSSMLPKVMHPLGGIPLLERVVNTAKSLQPKSIQVVHGNGGSMVHDAMAYLDVIWVKQSKQLGTGHAVLQAMPHCDPEDKILVLYADVPLISLKTLKLLLKNTPKKGLGLVVTELQDPSGFGRIIRNEMANITAIVEHKDANEEQLKIQEINTGILTTRAKHLQHWLPQLGNTNKQGEYYLTDIVSLAVADGCPVGGVHAHCHEEVKGVNDRWQLAELERYYQQQTAYQLTLQGVTVMDPQRLDVRGEGLQLAQDTTLDVNVVLEGKVIVDSNTVIGPNVYLRNVEIGQNVTIMANSVIEDAIIGDDCTVGPFARIRPGTVLEQGAKVGNFVETKKATLGKGSKASHLSYLGDAVIGARVNIGAGTITCNYDGQNKHVTKIGDGAFIGSNTSLVAPVAIGEDATIGAGSTITQDAPAEKLTLARERQRTLDNWKKPTRKTASQPEEDAAKG